MNAGDALLLAALVAPFAGAPLALLLRRAPAARDAASVAVAAASAIAAVALASAGRDASLSWSVSAGLSLSFRADALALLFATLATTLWAATAVYSIGYMRSSGGGHALARYQACFALVLGASVGVALAANLFTLVVFYEIITVSAYPLVAHAGTDAARAAGRRYLLFTLSGGSLLALAVGAAHAAGMPLAFVPGGDPRLAEAPALVARAVALLLVTGFAVKATLVPLHAWLPAAMVAPTPVSGLLHAVAVVVAGVFGLLRAFASYLPADLAVESGARALVLALAAVSLVVASVAALLQDDLKLRLAYSTIAQLAIVSLGAALLAPHALAGASLHVVAHSVAKLAMFLVAGILATHLGVTRVSEMDGAGRRSPWVMGAFALATLALLGLPPLPPSLSKEWVAVGAREAGLPALGALVTLSTLLTAAYLAPILARAFLREAQGPAPATPRSMLVPLVALLALGLPLALSPAGPLAFASEIARDAFGEKAPPAAPEWAVLDAGLAVALVLAAFGALALVARTAALARAARALLALARGALALGARAAGRLRAAVLAAANATGRLETEDLRASAAVLVAALLATLAWLAWGWA